MKKLISILFAVVLAASILFAGCEGGDNPTQPSNQTQAPGESTAAPTGERPVIKVGRLQNINVIDYDNNALTNYIEEVTGCDMQFQFFSSRVDDAKTQISARIAGGEQLPDILMSIALGSSVYTQYGREGYFVDLSEYFEDEEKSANFWNMLRSNFDQSFQDTVIRTMTDPETGAIYGFPIIEESIVDTMDFAPYINKVWLDKLGLKAPTNINELYDVLVAFRDLDPNGNGQKDEIPLIGYEGVSNSYVVEWIINMYMYYNRNRMWNVDENGQLYLCAATKEYREALTFMNKLVKEGLLSQSSWTNSQTAMQGITTPADGVAKAGIFLGHLTLHVELDNEVLYEYEPLPFWGNVTRRDNTISVNTFITKDCEDPSAAFDFIMHFYTKDMAIRGRYGEKGVNWVDADPGTYSYVGKPAEINVINDVFGHPTSAHWNSVPVTINMNAENEVSQFDDTLNEWQYYKRDIFSKQIKNFQEAEAKTVDISSGPLILTEDEKATTDMIRSNCGTFIANQRTYFIQGSQDVTNDNTWNAYLEKLNEYGIETYRILCQGVYDRQNAK